MQVSAVNSTNFGDGYYMEMSKDDIKKAEMLNRKLREYSDSFTHSSNSEDEQPKKKNIIGVAASVVAGSVVIFSLARKGYKGVSSIAKTVASNKYVQKIETLLKSTAAAKKVEKAAESVGQRIASNETALKIGEIAKKIGPEKTVAGLATLGVTAYVARSDGDYNGIPDIAEKGVKAYKDAIFQIDAIKDIVELIS